MKNELIALIVAALSIVGVLYAPQSQQLGAFDQWKAEHGVNYAPEQELYRRIIFESNVAQIEAHNADPTQTYTMGVNQFTALTQEEFEHIYLSAIPPSDAIMLSNREDIELPNGDIDWTTKGRVSGVKNQGQCGSCWAFSATGVCESWALGKGQKVSLSEQQLVDCSGSYGNHGCNGGWPSSALKYIQAKGIASESEYSYTAKTGTCKKDGGSFKIAGQGSFSGTSGLASGIQSQPISVTVDASNWSSYRSGVFSNCGKSINHAVLLVGVISNNWKIKNSWGTGWGAGGYITLASGNTCGIGQYAGVVPK